MHYYILSAFLVAAGPLCAQTAKPSVTAAAGGHLQNTFVSVDQTIGEPITATHAAGENMLTQGFHQPFVSTVGIEEWSAAEVKLFPNPAENYATVILPDQTYTLFAVYDAAGKLVMQRGITANTFDLPVVGWSPGVYKLSLEGKLRTTLTFIKH